ncbi:uncharacterized protein [Aristolochia californica]|uniref:uncharacterized protein n=1 Tax=Aristolochia californica TaxID=171875 RepID=UPI0035E001B9
MMERRSKNLCYNYDEPYWVGHQCKRLFLIDTVEDDDIEVTKDMIEEAPPEISLDAITGQKSPKIMQVRAQIFDRELVGLVDSGNTHNFLCLTAALHLQLQILPHPTATVSVANGEKVPSYGISKAVNFTIGTTLFHAKCFVISLAGFDMVLGIKWLETLGPILWDFSALTMSFVLRGSQVLLQGSRTETQQHIHSLIAPDNSAGSIDGMIDEFSNLFCETTGLPPLRQCDHLKDKFPIPVVEELLDELHGSWVFTKLDLRSGYHQIRMHPADIEKMAFRTHHGHFEFVVMPFGLSNATSTFQALMNEKFKCSFGASHVAYLGHIISHEGATVDPEKIQAISEWPQPQSCSAVRAFLGLAGYYQKFIWSFGPLAVPLTNLLKKNSFQWNEEASMGFDALKNALASTPVLQLPNFDDLFVIECDASGGGIGAMLHQNSHPIAYFSR